MIEKVNGACYLQIRAPFNGVVTERNVHPRALVGPSGITSAVARTTEATFVVQIRNGNPEWVNVRTGEVDGKLIEIFADVRQGDEVALPGTDELRPGKRVNTRFATRSVRLFGYGWWKKKNEVWYAPRCR